MVWTRWSVQLVLMVCILMVAPPGQGQDLLCAPGTGGIATWGCSSPSGGFFATLGVRKYINSFTSYQFPDPIAVQLNPLSRLEWPWEQAYGLVRLGKDFETFGIKIEYASTALLGSGLKAQDSDWEDPNNPGQKTTFSQGKAKPRGWTLDISTTVPVPNAQLIKGIAGFRSQQFNFTYTDVLQSSIALFDANDNFIGYRPVVRELLSGAVIEFTEYYKHWYIGGAVARLIPLGALTERLESAAIIVKAQLDWGYVRANNHDFHLLRGDRHTYEKTVGSSWHANLALGLYAGQQLKVDLEGDFIRIKTTGSHQLVDGTPPAVNAGWDGAKVWSDQQFVTVTGSYTF
jgi:hypothetical protein